MPNATPLTVPAEIDARQIALPTGGAVIDKVVQQDQDAPHLVAEGRVLPVDPEAPPIRFRILLPVGGWNGRLLHVGCGGFGGAIPSLGNDGVGSEMWRGRPSPVAQGYVVVGSDSGHQYWREDAATLARPDAADFSSNPEALANFAHESIAKVHDVAVELACTAYGMVPRHSYFVGTSNGGREALLAAQRYPERFDGVIAGYPTIYWVPMALLFNHVADVEEAVGAEGFVGLDDWRAANHVLDDARARGLSDGATRDLLTDVLCPAQMRVIDAATSDLDVSFLHYEGARSYPGFDVLGGEPLRGDETSSVPGGLSSAPGMRDGLFAGFGRAVLSRQVLLDRDVDVRRFSTAGRLRLLRRASALLDAASPDLDVFEARGGKAIIYHGTCDPAVSVRSSKLYLGALADRYGQGRLDDFARLYVVEGLGHGAGPLCMGADLLGVLDRWADELGTPDAIDAEVVVPDGETRGVRLHAFCGESR